MRRGKARKGGKVSTHASVRRRLYWLNSVAVRKEVSTHASVRRRHSPMAQQWESRMFQLTPP